MVFFIFGYPLYVWGGTIMQLFIPLLFIIAFCMKKDFFASGFSTLWFGESFINVGYYVADARAQDLELLAGEHDWAYLLGRMNLLQSDQIIGKWLFSIGAFLMILGLLVSLIFTFIGYFKKDSVKNDIDDF